MNTSISALLEHKGSGVFSVTPSISVAEAVREMNYFKVGSVLVLDGDRLVGIFTERDVLMRVVAAGRDPRQTALVSVMTCDPVTVDISEPVEHVMDLFTERRFRHLPVMDHSRLAGVISIGDVLRAVAEENRQEADQLRQYIAGGYPS